MVYRNARKELKSTCSEEKVVSNAYDGRVRVEAWNDRVYKAIGFEPNSLAIMYSDINDTASSYRPNNMKLTKGACHCHNSGNLCNLRLPEQHQSCREPFPVAYSIE